MARSPPLLPLHVHSPTTTTATAAMENFGNPLGLLVRNLSDENYAQSVVCYRFWFDIGRTYHQLPPDPVFDAIWNHRGASSVNPACGQLIHPTAHLILRFARDAESDSTFAGHNVGLQTRLCSMTLREFFSKNLLAVAYGGYYQLEGGGSAREFFADVNLIAHWINLGFVGEDVIRDQILQSLISHPKLYNHQADALIVLFKLSGAAFGAYAVPSVVDRCFKLLNGHNHTADKKKQVQVCVPRHSEGGRRAKVDF